MMKKTTTLILTTVLWLTAMVFNACEKKSPVIDFPEINEQGKIVAITGYSPTSYFVYRGQPMGYEYELLQMLGDHLNLKVEIKLASDIEEMIQMLESGEGDLIAYGLTITATRRNKLAFTSALNTTRQVLVQRKPDNWRQMKLHEIEQLMAREPFDLAGKTIHLRKGSSYIERIENLALEIGEEIFIEEATTGTTTEELINLVAQDSIAFTVADENIAYIQASELADIDIRTPVSLPQQTAWAVRPSSVILLDTLNHWLDEVQNTVDYYVIYNKYFKNRRAYLSRVRSEFLLAPEGGKISPYDDLIKQEAERLGWDWRLLAALIYQESQFNPRARSWAGALGLMQLMPATARQFGADNPLNPQQNIKAGVNFLLWLEQYWENHIEDPYQRLLFVIASYNTGHGHVQDARKLAELQGIESTVWHDHVERFMLKKSDPDYYNLDVVTHGYASGSEPVAYVHSVFDFYKHYQQFTD